MWSAASRCRRRSAVTWYSTGSRRPMSAFRFDGRVALVTGARPGIGGAVAGALAEAGAEVVLANRTREAAEDVAEPLRKLGLKVHVVPFSSDEAGARGAVAS